MNRARPVEALLAALAVLGGLPSPHDPVHADVGVVPAERAPRRASSRSSAWGCGASRRRARSSSSGRSCCSCTAPRVLHGQGHLWSKVVPIPETGAAFGVLLTEAYETVTNYTAPAPSNRGTILAVSLLIGLTAVAVDAIGVTYRSPALAGVPLLSAFLASATNSGDGLGAWFAVPGALAWLALVGRQGVRSLRSWGTAAAAPRSSTGPLRRPHVRVRRRSAGSSG